jgi:hypothetical protein
LTATATRLLHAPAGDDTGAGPEDRGGEVDPQAVEPQGDDCRGQRAGFSDVPLIGPANSASRAITDPTATPARRPFSFEPVETLRITNMRISVRMNSSTNDWKKSPAGRVTPSVAWVGNVSRRVTLARTAPSNWLMT